MILAQPKNATQNEKIRKIIDKSGYDDAWIGVNDRRDDNKWKFVDGSDVPHTFWKTGLFIRKEKENSSRIINLGEPNQNIFNSEDCVTVSSDGIFNF